MKGDALELRGAHRADEPDPGQAGQGAVVHTGPLSFPTHTPFEQPFDRVSSYHCDSWHRGLYGC